MRGCAPANSSLLDVQMQLAHGASMTTLGEMTACIADEVNQPLATVVTNAKACLSWLRRGTPDAIRRVQALAKKTSLEKVALDVNEPGEGDHPVGAAGAIQGSQGWRISPRSLRTKDESLAKDPPTRASMPPLLSPHNTH